MKLSPVLQIFSVEELLSWHTFRAQLLALGASEVTVDNFIDSCVRWRFDRLEVQRLEAHTEKSHADWLSAFENDLEREGSL